ncbi:MAG: alpha/beta hydrolase [Thermoguttaceae bacterium]|nr:alpha/beta hydrolase [Thermoguttaceae bacterium]
MQRIVSTRRAFLLAAVAVSFLFAPISIRAQEEPEFQQISDVVYKKVGDREIKLNLFLPLKDGKTVKGEPLLIWLDSGCWYSGDPGDGGLWKAMGALNRGFAVASVSHRPINEEAFPVPMEDVRAAVRFLRKHADEYGYDPNRFAVAGASSGGHLSLTLGISDEKSPFNVGDNLDVSGQVQRVVDYFGPADFTVAFDRYAKESIDCVYIAVGMPREAANKENVEQYAELQARAKKFSPIFYVDGNYAPTIILQGTNDPLVPLTQSSMMYETLRLAGVRTQLMVSDGGVHNPSTLFSADQQIREIFEFLQW